MKKYYPYPVRDQIKDYFPLPNEIFNLELHSTAIAVYAYLMKLENRKTYDCFPSYETIGTATGIRSTASVAKYVRELEETGLIATEARTLPMDIGIVRNSTLRYNIRPIQEAIDRKHNRQMAALELAVSQMKAQDLAQRRMVSYLPADESHGA